MSMTNEVLQKRPTYFIPFKMYVHLTVKWLQLWEMGELWRRDSQFPISFKYLVNVTSVMSNGLATQLIWGH